MRQVTLNDCPECGYSLQGLPARPWRASVGLLVLTALVLKGTAQSIVAVVGRTSSSNQIAEFLFAGVMLVISGVAVVRLIRMTRDRRYVAVTPSGVRARYIGGTVDVPWSRVRGARYRDSGVELLFVRPDSGETDWRYIDDMGHGALKSRKDGLAFCEFLEAEIRRRDVALQSGAI